MIRTIILTFIIATVFVFAGECRITSLAAKSDGKSIKVEWKTSYEVSVARFEVERSVGDHKSFQKIATVSAKSGGETYSYIDNDAFMKDGSNKLAQASQYSYQLRVVYTDNSSEYSDPVSVTHNVSSVRRTWGMIKEMFR